MSPLVERQVYGDNGNNVGGWDATYHITKAFLFRLYDVSAPCQVFQYICANILIIIRYYIYNYIYEMRILAPANRRCDRGSYNWYWQS